MCVCVCQNWVTQKMVAFLFVPFLTHLKGTLQDNHMEAERNLTFLERPRVLLAADLPKMSCWGSEEIEMNSPALGSLPKKPVQKTLCEVGICHNDSYRGGSCDGRIWFSTF